MSARKRDRGRTTMPAEYDPEEQAEIHAVLGDERRLAVLDVLACVGWIQQRPLAAEIASREQGRDVDPSFDEASEADHTAVSDVLLSLYGEHLPEMEAAGAVAYEGDVIAQGAAFDDALNARNAVAVSQGVPVESEPQEESTHSVARRSIQHAFDFDLGPDFGYGVGGDADGE